MSATRESELHMARVYLQQARAQRIHRGWAACLLNWAGERRRAAMACLPPAPVPVQESLF